MRGPQWIEEGVYYGADGRFVGRYYSTNPGWSVELGFPAKRLSVRTRKKARGVVEAAALEAATPVPSREEPRR